MPVDPSLLPQILKEAEKRYGQKIYTGRARPSVTRIPFPSLEMNLATHGGAPMGRIIRLWGGPSSCKTLSAIGLAASAQKFRTDEFPDGLSVAFYDLEGAFDYDFAEKALGLDTSDDKFVYVDASVIEDVSRILDSLLHAVNIHIIDSTTYGISEHKIEAGVSSRQPGFDAIAWKEAFKLARENMDPMQNMIVCISHETQDFKTSAIKASGGRFLDYSASMSMRHRVAAKLYRGSDGELGETRPKDGNDPLTGSVRVDGYFLEIEIVKTKVSRPFNKANLIYDVDRMQFDRRYELMKAGQFLGVIQKSGNYYYVPTSDKAINGQRALKKRIEEDDVLVMQIYEAADRWIAEQQANERAA